MNKTLGLREQVKKGQLNPKAALARLISKAEARKESEIVKQSKLWGWLKRRIEERAREKKEKDCEKNY